MDSDLDSREFQNRSRRIGVLRDQLRRENRRSAAPFSHPLAVRGPLSKLSDQIRDVSRISEAIAHSAEAAGDRKVDELCANLRRLLQTQQRWTERLENQIWRLESQTRLMRRLQQVLLQHSPATDQIWELCEQIARETQSLPDGLLLLPEPGHHIVMTANGINQLAASAIERARFSVFAAMTIQPEVRGADIVAGAFRQWAHRTSGLIIPSIDELAIETFAAQLMSSLPSKDISESSSKLVEVTDEFSRRVDQHSETAAENIVPPAVREFFRVIWDDWTPEDGDQPMAAAVSKAFGVDPKMQPAAAEETDDRLVLAHKLRWHDGAENAARPRGTHFQPASATRRFSVVSDSED